MKIRLNDGKVALVTEMRKTYTYANISTNNAITYSNVMKVSFDISIFSNLEDIGKSTELENKVGLTVLVKEDLPESEIKQLLADRLKGEIIN